MFRTILAHSSAGAVVKMILTVSGDTCRPRLMASATVGSYAPVTNAHMDTGSSSIKIAFCASAGMNCIISAAFAGFILAMIAAATSGSMSLLTHKEAARASIPFITCAAAAGGKDSMMDARAAGGASLSMLNTLSSVIVTTAALSSVGDIIAAAHAAFCGFKRCKTAAATSGRISESASPASSSSSLRIMAMVESTCCGGGGLSAVPNVKVSSSSSSSSSSAFGSMAVVPMPLAACAAATAVLSLV